MLFRVVAVLLALPVLALAQQSTPQLVDNYTDWMLYTFTNEQGQVCYIASLPTKEDGNYTRRGPAAVLVAKLPLLAEDESEQVSVQPGYTYLKDSTVEVTIGTDTYELFTDGQHAWAYTSDDDRRLISAMRRGSEMKVQGTSTKETFSLDTYSLRGFTAAYNALKDACAG